MNECFDAIVIGSGIGGMTTANLLARLRGKRVLILEQHFQEGGFTHVFQRKGFHWDVGVHYLGQLGEGMAFRRFFDYLTDGALGWNRLPDDFDVFEYPDFTFSVPSNEGEYRNRLKVLFPGEARGIDAWFEGMKAAADYVGRYSITRLLPGPAGSVAARLVNAFSGQALHTTKQVLDRTFRDERIKAVLASQWGDYGLPPSRSAFAGHAIVATHYLHGAWYPEGGARQFAATLLPTVIRAGGECRTRSEVVEILLRKGRACGVRVRDHRRRDAPEYVVEAPIIISNAGAFNTCAKLLPEQHHVNDLAEMQGNMKSAITLYIGFKDDPRTLGFRGENRWIFSGYDHERMGSEDTSGGEITSGFLSFPSLRTESAKHAADFTTMGVAEPFARWAHLPWKKRGEEYQAAKDRISESILGLLEKKYPGFRGMTEYVELSTPLTVQSLTGHPRGAIYGLPATPERFRLSWPGVRGPHEGLVFTGADVLGSGIAGSLMGGIVCAAHLLGVRGFPEILKAAGISLRDL